jgi:hypothetical protein
MSVGKGIAVAATLDPPGCRTGTRMHGECPLMPQIGC